MDAKTRCCDPFGEYCQKIRENLSRGYVTSQRRCGTDPQDPVFIGSNQYNSLENRFVLNSSSSMLRVKAPDEKQLHYTSLRCAVSGCRDIAGHTEASIFLAYANLLIHIIKFSYNISKNRIPYRINNTALAKGYGPSSPTGDIQAAGYDITEQISM